MCVSHWACAECVITYPLSDCTLQPHTTKITLASSRTSAVYMACMCVCVCVSPHLRLVTMEIGQAAGTWGKSRTMWFSRDTHCAPLVEKAQTQTHMMMCIDGGEFLEVEWVQVQVSQTPWPCAGGHKETTTCGPHMEDIFHMWGWTKDTGCTSRHSVCLCMCVVYVIIFSYSEYQQQLDFEHGENCHKVRSWLLQGSQCRSMVMFGFRLDVKGWRTQFPKQFCS